MPILIIVTILNVVIKLCKFNINILKIIINLDIKPEYFPHKVHNRKQIFGSTIYLPKNME